MTPAAVTGIGVAPLLLLVLLACVVIALVLRAKGKGSRWILAVPMALVAILLLVVFLWTSVPKQVSVQQFGSPGGVDVSRAAGRATPAIWASGLEDQFEADVYPSLRSAAKALGRRLAKRVSNSIGDQGLTMPVQLRRVQQDNRIGMETVDAVAAGLRAAGFRDVLATTHIESAAVSGDLTMVRQAIVTIRLHASHRTSLSDALKGSSLIAEASADGRQFAETVQYVDKPWVENFAAFISGEPERHWILARSQDSCTTADQAQRQALDDACVVLLQLCGPETTGPRWLASRRVRMNPADIQAGNVIVDRFAQSFQGTAGPIWRQALLLDASPDKLSQLQHADTARRAGQRRGWLGRFASLAGVLALICVVYLFLNAATKGYYTWALRIAAFVLIVTAALVVLAFVA